MKSKTNKFQRDIKVALFLARIKDATGADMIELMPTRIKNSLNEYVNQILECIGQSDAIVTDESYIYDFCTFDFKIGKRNPESIRTITNQLRTIGIDIKSNEKIVDIALRLQKKREK